MEKSNSGRKVHIGLGMRVRKNVHLDDFASDAQHVGVVRIGFTEDCT
jgi:hypothetical protein